MLKTIISDFKIIIKFYKNTTKEYLVIIIGCIFASIFGIVISDSMYFLFLSFISVFAIAMHYKTNVFPYFREIEREVELENKYQFLHDRFKKNEL